MLKSVLLAGFFWASANFMPITPVVTPVVTPIAVAYSQPPMPVMTAVEAPHPVQMASLASFSKSRVAWEFPAPMVSPDTLSSDEEEFVTRINAERTSRGLNSLTVDTFLVQTARAHSREMCDLNYFSHHSPTSGQASPMDRYLTGMKALGMNSPDYLLVGENIFYCSIFNNVYNADYGHRALMDSPGHRANILDPRFTKVGLGIYHNARGEFWVTQMFTKESE